MVKSRTNDFGIWSDSKMSSFGASNKDIISSIDKSVIPEVFHIISKLSKPFQWRNPDNIRFTRRCECISTCYRCKR